MSIIKNSTKTLKDAVVTGGIASAVTYGLYQQGPAIGGLETYMAIGGSAAIGKVVGDLAHDYMFPNIPLTNKYNSALTAVVGPAAAGLTTCVIFKAAGIPLNRAIEAGAFTAGAYVAADYGMNVLSPFVPGGL